MRDTISADKRRALFCDLFMVICPRFCGTPTFFFRIDHSITGVIFSFVRIARQNVQRDEMPNGTNCRILDVLCRWTFCLFDCFDPCEHFDPMAFLYRLMF